MKRKVAKSGSATSTKTPSPKKALRTPNREEPLLDIDTWMPYRLWSVVRNSAECLEAFYGVNYNLTRMGWQALAVLACHAPLSAKELGQLSGLNQVDVTRTIGKLLKLKMVDRGTSTQDRRRASLEVSKRGMEAYNAIAPVAITIEKILIDALSPGDREQLSIILAKLRAAESQILEYRLQWKKGGPLQLAG